MILFMYMITNFAIIAFVTSIDMHQRISSLGQLGKSDAGKSVC